jgi:flagellar biosynthesis GTPase FlhF
LIPKCRVNTDRERFSRLESMGRFSALMLALILGGASAVVLASCGGGSDAKLLPGTTASEIESNLDQVRQLVAEGDCIGAEDAVAEVAAEVEEVNVAAKLKAALNEGTTKLSEVVGRCEEEAAEAEEAEPSEEADVEAEEAEAKELKAEEKAEEKAEKLKETEEKAEEKAEAPEAEEKELPPQANGEAKGHEEAPPVTPTPTPEAGEEESSGGVSPGVGVE